MRANKQDFAKPLADYIEIDRDGHASFSYPMRMGALIAITSHARTLVGRALRARGKDREKLLKEAAAYLEENCAETILVAQMWDEYMQRRTAEAA